MRHQRIPTKEAEYWWIYIVGAADIRLPAKKDNNYIQLSIVEPKRSLSQSDNLQACWYDSAPKNRQREPDSTRKRFVTSAGEEALGEESLRLRQHFDEHRSNKRSQLRLCLELANYWSEAADIELHRVDDSPDVRQLVRNANPKQFTGSI